MKTSEQMTTDVLKRRDELLRAKPSKISRLIKIGVPCAAAVAITAVAAAEITRGYRERLEFINSSEMNSNFSFQAYITHAPGNGDVKPGGTRTAIGYSTEKVETSRPAEYSDEDKMEYIQSEFSSRHSTSASSIGTPDIASVPSTISTYPSYPGDPAMSSLPAELGNIVFNAVDKDTLSELKEPVILEGQYFVPKTLEELNYYYRAKLDALLDLYPDWKMEHGQLGFYQDEGNDGFTAWMRYIWRENSFDFTSPDGKKAVRVDVNFASLPFNHYTFKDLEKSTINGIEVELISYRNALYAQFSVGTTGYLISGKGVSEEEFTDIVASYIPRIQTPDKPEIGL